MGALHAGHLALVGEARRRAGCVAVTIFVNPTQFGPGEDFDRYPRDLEADASKCEEAGASLVFAPETSAMYPPAEETRVRVGRTAEPLCGAHRPGHFEGVTTVVTKLFALAGPCTAVFGRKDYQQLKVIERMVADLFLPVAVVGFPIVREADGLALSSRNAYLSPAEREAARAVPEALTALVRAHRAGTRGAGALAGVLRETLAPRVNSIDYADVADATTLRVLDAAEQVGARALAAVAVRVGKTRLIDNVVLGEDPAPVESAHRIGAGG
jgi:pantoate--beta-alanine ligase